jgi:hypothetical protein
MHFSLGWQQARYARRRRKRTARFPRPPSALTIARDRAAKGSNRSIPSSDVGERATLRSRRARSMPEARAGRCWPRACWSMATPTVGLVLLWSPVRHEARAGFPGALLGGFAESCSRYASQTSVNHRCKASRAGVFAGLTCRIVITATTISAARSPMGGLVAFRNVVRARGPRGREVRVAAGIGCDETVFSVAQRAPAITGHLGRVFYRAGAERLQQRGPGVLAASERADAIAAVKAAYARGGVARYAACVHESD